MVHKIKSDLELRINQMLTEYKKEKISLDNATETIISLLKVKENSVPMGVSQWRNHGVKYHYIEYFLKDLFEDIEGVLLEDSYKVAYKDALLDIKQAFYQI